MNPQLPACHEDETLIGAGDFSDGHWSTYVCGPAVDDYLLPDTAMNSPGLGESLAMVILITALIVVDRIRRHR